MAIIISDISGIDFIKDYSHEYSIYFVIGKNEGNKENLSGLTYSGLFINNTDLPDLHYKRMVVNNLRKLDHIVLCIDSDRKVRDKYKNMGIKSVHPSQIYDGILNNIFVTDLFYLG